MFNSVISEHESAGLVVGSPQPFTTYARTQGFSNESPAPNISVDSYSRLNADLKRAGYMVFRLGSRDGQPTTHFGLAKFQNKKDFFLIDDEIFLDCKASEYFPNVENRTLAPYMLLPAITETSIINLAFASGLVANALKLESGKDIVVPATAQSKFTFKVKPKDSCDVIWDHQSGQVEIDALFVGKRAGVECLFIVEAKISRKLSSLAKHKLVYPILAIASNIPRDMPIIPIYIRCMRSLEKDLLFYIAELEFYDPRERLAGIDSLQVKSTGKWILRGF